MEHTPTNRVLIIIPAFDEEPHVAAVVRGARDAFPGAEILVVDDGSTDRTGEMALGAGARVARHPFNMGYGAALQTGFIYALSRGCTHAVTLDGDGQHDPAFIPGLLAPVLEGRADVAVGSRFLEKGGYRPPFRRRAGMLLFGFLASALSGRRVTDPTSGFQAVNRRALSLFATRHYPQDFPDADVLILLSRAGLSVTEVPVSMRPAPDSSSMHSGFKPLYYVFKMLLSIALAAAGDRPPGLESGRGKGEE